MERLTSFLSPDECKAGWRSDFRAWVNCDRPYEAAYCTEQIISNVDAYQAQLINRDSRHGSVLVPGESVFIMEVEPAAYISVAVNEAEKNADIKVVTFDPVGRYGRLYVSGVQSEVRSARDAAIAAIESMEGRM